MDPDFALLGEYIKDSGEIASLEKQLKTLRSNILQTLKSP